MSKVSRYRVEVESARSLLFKTGSVRETSEQHGRRHDEPRVRLRERTERQSVQPEDVGEERGRQQTGTSRPEADTQAAEEEDQPREAACQGPEGRAAGGDLHRGGGQSEQRERGAGEEAAGGVAGRGGRSCDHRLPRRSDDGGAGRAWSVLRARSFRAHTRR